MVEVIMPPTIGAAIGFITSEPIPLSHKIGMRLARTAVTVMSFGRNLHCTLNGGSFNVLVFESHAEGETLVERLVEADDHDHPSFYSDAE
jgi:hypothetical protein